MSAPRLKRRDRRLRPRRGIAFGLIGLALIGTGVLGPVVRADGLPDQGGSPSSGLPPGDKTALPADHAIPGEGGTPPPTGAVSGDAPGNPAADVPSDGGIPPTPAGGDGRKAAPAVGAGAADGGLPTVERRAKTGTEAVFAAPLIEAAEAPPVDLAPDAVSAILVDMDTGTVLYEKNADEKRPPASITKIMTLLLIMEALERGDIRITDVVTASERAASMGGSQIFLAPGERMTVEDLIKAIAIASANDASVAMAEHLAGSEAAFVARMNEKAKALGMNNTHFANATGLPVENHYTTARDIAIMSRALIAHEAVLRYTSLYEDYLRKDTDRPFWLVNTNRLVRFYEGMDGLKTGYTSEARYGLSATAKRGDLRLIAVVLGEPTAKTRNRDITAMLDYGFAHYTSVVLVPKGTVVGAVRVDKGDRPVVHATAPHAVSLLRKKGAAVGKPELAVTLPAVVPAPVHAGDPLGTLVVRDGDRTVRVPLVAAEGSGRASFGTLFNRMFYRLVEGRDPVSAKIK
ncbi:serine hydrolase [Hydrogenibacillus schlegelii]|uniref:D-alanyl-D-alanine carboxypeptidase family protein n=1 Tax=Hydrogenibacillus schlegelii TaxID=1484 RepID=UPI001FE19717|nr:D-alanyl-D-alanine carboxypeptidase family protein [Hydrogenibacillus schlegelii]